MMNATDRILKVYGQRNGKYTLDSGVVLNVKEHIAIITDEDFAKVKGSEPFRKQTIIDITETGDPDKASDVALLREQSLLDGVRKALNDDEIKIVSKFNPEQVATLKQAVRDIAEKNPNFTPPAEDTTAGKDTGTIDQAPEIITKKEKEGSTVRIKRDDVTMLKNTIKDMKVPALKQVATQLEIDITGLKSKSELLEVIETFLKQKLDEFDNEQPY